MTRLCKDCGLRPATVTSPHPAFVQTGPDAWSEITEVDHLCRRCEMARRANHHFRDVMSIEEAIIR